MRAAYEDMSFRESVEEIYNQIAPLYKQLFTYVRRKLLQRYGERNIRPDGPIPAHLLGELILLFTGSILKIKDTEKRNKLTISSQFFRDAPNISYKENVDKSETTISIQGIQIPLNLEWASPAIYH